MTGTFVRCSRASLCVSMHCHNAIVVGSWTYLFMNLERQMVCPECALRRWGYVPPADQPLIALPTARKVDAFSTFDRQSAGGELRRNILNRRELDEANSADGKLRQTGVDR